MAKNYTMGQAARIFAENKVEEMADIMRRFPYASMMLMKLNEEGVLCLEALPEFETVRKLDKLRRKALGILRSRKRMRSLLRRKRRLPRSPRRLMNPMRTRMTRTRRRKLLRRSPRSPLRSQRRSKRTTTMTRMMTRMRSPLRSLRARSPRSPMMMTTISISTTK